jgi:hypothetical protein
MCQLLLPDKFREILENEAGPCHILMTAIWDYALLHAREIIVLPLHAFMVEVTLHC